jgi:hypothetical protein
MIMELGGSALLYDPGGGKCGRPDRCRSRFP